MAIGAKAPKEYQHCCEHLGQEIVGAQDIHTQPHQQCVPQETKPCNEGKFRDTFYMMGFASKCEVIVEGVVDQCAEQGTSD